MSWKGRGKPDANQKEIVTELRAIGASVLIINSIDKSFDILVGFRGKNFAFEIKLNEKKKLTPAEHKFQLTWCGQVSTIYSFEQAVEQISQSRL